MTTQQAPERALRERIRPAHAAPPSASTRTLRIAALSSAVALAACGARTELFLATDAQPAQSDASTAFPAGTFTRCATGLWDNSLNAIGVLSGASLTVTARGSSVDARFVDQNHQTHSYAFTATSNLSAALVTDGSEEPGYSISCVQGPGRTSSQPATLRLEAGSLAFDTDTMFLVVTGTLNAAASGPCGPESLPANVWVACRGAGATPPSPASPVVAAAVADGSYNCRSQVATYGFFDGTNEYIANGATGTLALSQGANGLSLTYSGDRTVSGTLDFVGTSDSTARLASVHALQATCDAPVRPTPSTTVEAVDGVAGSLTQLGPTLFVTLAGTMTGSCAGADKFVTLQCTRP